MNGKPVFILHGATGKKLPGIVKKEDEGTLTVKFGKQDIDGTFVKGDTFCLVFQRKTGKPKRGGAYSLLSSSEA